MPREAVDNLERLKAIGALGRYGYHDAVDFTPQRVPEGTDHAVVYNYMAHHQGMSIVAVANAIFEGRMRDRFHSDPVIEAAELLLQEKAPRDIPVATVRTEADERVKGVVVEQSPDTRLVLNPASRAALDQPDVQRPLFGDGDGDRLRLQPLGRDRGDALAGRSDRGPARHLHLPARHLDQRVVVGDGGAEEGARTSSARRCFSDDKATFIKTVGTLGPKSSASSSRKAMARRAASPSSMTARPTGTSRSRPSPSWCWRRRPTTTRIRPSRRCSSRPRFRPAATRSSRERRKRAPNEPDIAAAHFVTDPSGVARDAEAETDRRAFIGRGRTHRRSGRLRSGARAWPATTASRSTRSWRCAAASACAPTRRCR